ncbi:MAG: riboflavin biosynthesis protein RibF [Bacilli bacterium]
MKTILLDLDNIAPFDHPTSLCLGNFDGVHIGHQKLITQAVLDSGGEVAILTFDAPIGTIIDGRKAKDVLTSVSDRFRIIHRLGADYLLVAHLEARLLNMMALDFIEQVLNKLNINKIFIGEDFRFGKGQTGDVDLLKKHFEVIALPLLDVEHQKVSTSQIITLIKHGDIIRANQLLGRHYQMHGVVGEGLHNGRTIGFPTANLKLSAPYVIPKFGVYKTVCYIDGFPHLSLTNVGIHPTIQELDMPSIEVHIPNYEGDDYGKSMYLEFIAFLRPEKHFASLDELREQIAVDIASIKP